MHSLKILSFGIGIDIIFYLYSVHAVQELAANAKNMVLEFAKFKKEILTQKHCAVGMTFHFSYQF